jgi:WD40 repeat protein
MTVILKRTIVLITSAIIILAIFIVTAPSDLADPDTGSSDENETSPPDVVNFTQLWIKGYGEVTSLVYSSNGSELAISSTIGGIYIFNSDDYSLNREFIFRDRRISSMDWLSEDSKMAICTGRKITILNSMNGHELNTFENNRSLDYLKFSPDGTKLAAGRVGRFKIYDIESGKTLLTVNGSYKFAWSPDSSMIAYPDEWNVTIINATSGDLIKTLQGFIQPDYDNVFDTGHISWSPDGLKIAFESHWRDKSRYESRLEIFNYITGMIIGIGENTVRADWIVSWSPYGLKIAAGTSSGNLNIYHSSNLSVMKEIEPESYSMKYFGLEYMSWSPIEDHIAMSRRNTINVIDVNSADTTHTIQEQTYEIGEISWSPDDKYFAYYYGTKNLQTGYHEGRIKIINSKTGDITKSFNESFEIRSLSWSPKGDEIAYSCLNLTKIIDVNTGAILRTFYHEGVFWVIDEAWSPNGDRIATGSNSNIVSVWNATSGELIFTLINHTYHISDIDWSPNGTSIASSSYDGTIVIWDAESGQSIKKFSLDMRRGRYNQIYAVSWSPDGKYIAGSYEHKVGIWDVFTGNQIDVYNPRYVSVGSSSSALVIKWSPDGSKLAVFGSKLIIWDFPFHNATVLYTFSRVENDLSSFAWSSDGKRIAAGYLDGVVRMWGSPADISILGKEIYFSKQDPKIGDEIDISITVHNFGKLNATDVFIFVFDNETLIDELTIDFLEREGGSETVHTSFKVSNKTHSIRVEIDPYDTVIEFNETNNIAYKSLVVEEQEELTNYLLMGILITIMFLVIPAILFRLWKSKNKR